MSVNMLFLLEASLLLIALQVVYRLFLQKLTFYKTNRWVLLGSLLFSFLGPLVPFPGWYTDVSDFIPDADRTISTTLSSYSFSKQLPPAQHSGIENMLEALAYLYWMGVIILLLWFLLRVVSLVKLVQTTKHETFRNYTLLVATQIGEPFSFYRYIGIDKEKYSPQTLGFILQHEQVHLRQWHSLDLLLIEIYFIFFWFNPFAWAHKKLIMLNLEYLADEGVLKEGIDAQSYQLSLLSVGTSQITHFLTNPFTPSFMKARIHMINRAHSAGKARLNYIWIVLAATGGIFLVTLSKAHQPNLQVYAPNRHIHFSAQANNRETGIHSSTAVGKQSRIIQGTVKTADTEKPMKDVQVMVVGSNKTAITDNQGRFSIEVSDKDKILEFVPVDYYTIKSDNYYPPLAMHITSADEMIVLLTRFAPLSPLKDTTLYFMDGKRISKEEYDKQAAKGYFPMEIILRPGIKKLNLINFGNVE